MNDEITISEIEILEGLKKDILATMTRIEEEEKFEGELDLKLDGLVLEYLEKKNIGFEIENMAVLTYDEEETANREVVFNDDFLTVTVEETDDESGEKAHRVWVKGS